VQLKQRLIGALISVAVAKLQDVTATANEMLMARAVVADPEKTFQRLGYRCADLIFTYEGVWYGSPGNWTYSNIVNPELLDDDAIHRVATSVLNKLWDDPWV
jgi:hypothetical protein